MEKVYAEYVQAEFLFPYSQGQKASYFMEHAHVLEQEYMENGIRMKVECHKADIGKYADCVTGKPGG